MNNTILHLSLKVFRMPVLSRIAVIFLILSITPAVFGQSFVGTINVPQGSDIWDIVLYQAGEKLFVGEYTTNQIFVYNSRTLEYIGPISFPSYLPYRQRQLAVSEEKGILFVDMDKGDSLGDSIIMVVNASTLALETTIPVNRLGSITVDEKHNRLYKNMTIYDEKLTAIDLTTYDVLGSLDIGAIMGDGLIAGGGLNPETGEFLYANLHYDKFVIANGPNLTGELISVPGSRGWTGTWNYLENKIYITTITWGGYFIYDRDTGASTITSCVNDGTDLFFDSATNRVYTSAEVNKDTTVIDGDTDACQNVEMPQGALITVGFVNSRNHAVFAGQMGGVYFFNEGSLTIDKSFPNIADGSCYQMAVDQLRRRIFIKYDNYPSTDYILVFDDKSPGGVFGDFNGDEKADLTVTRSGSPLSWYTRLSDTQADWLGSSWGLDTDLPVIGDYDGDKKADIAVWRPQTGTWYVLPSSMPGTFTSMRWGLSSDIPTPGDYDGDGKVDAAVWRPETGTWYVLKSSNPGSYTARPWGLNTDIPVPGDYDGDGKADIAVWRPSSGIWYILESSNPGSYTAKQWGLSSDIPTPGDYDGDGKADIAVRRSSDGIWYILSSANPESYTATVWGLADDIPVSGDYDGDGKTDIAVWRPSDGYWYILPSYSPGTYMATCWGLATDEPISSITGIRRLIP